MKSCWREIAMRGAPFSSEEMGGLLRYCEQDVTATALLLPHLINTFEQAHALLCGRYTLRAVSGMQYVGVPIDFLTFERIRDNWNEIRHRLIVEVDLCYRVYEDGKFKMNRFGELLNRLGIPWPRTPTGRLKVDDETFKGQTTRYPILNELRELRRTLATMRTIDLAVGPDARNRTSLMPFASRTGRNQPSNTRYIFGAAKWLRSLICPPPGSALIQLDYAQQEFLIAAALSGDTKMLQAYQSGDHYIASAILAGAVPPGATKFTHPEARAAFKTAVLGLQYGGGAETLGARLGDAALGQKIIDDHKRVYARYWRWSEDRVDKVGLGGELSTPFGWRIRAGNRAGEPNARSVANWPIQSAGAEILRIATVAMEEHGIRIAAPIHDAVLIEAPADEAESVAELAERLMRESSQVVLGVPCGVDRTLIPPGSRYRDERGDGFFGKVQNILETL
ncbi:MAG TPA: DNA polymerase [Verrucomicrobiales bacterium]|nr:DNA polymerase [Verrucomicrobiales bacterium]